MQGILKPPLDPFSELTLAGQLGFPGGAAAAPAIAALVSLGGPLGLKTMPRDLNISSKAVPKHGEPTSPTESCTAKHD